MAEDGFRQSYKFRIYPTEEQKAWMLFNIGVCRYVYNRFLTERKASWERTQETLRRPVCVPGTEGDERPEWVRGEDGKVVYEDRVNESYDPSAKVMTLFDTSKALTALKKELVDEDGHAWLKDADSVSLIYALRNLDAAYQNFFRGRKQGRDVGYPRYKGRGDSRKGYKTGGPRVEVRDADGNVVGYNLPKAGPVKTRVHRQPEGVFVSAAVSVTPSGKWYLAASYKEVPKERLEANGGQEIGLTYGVSHWAVGSNGEVFDLPERLARLQRQKRRLNRRLSRKQEGSKNREKARLRLARKEEQIADLRADATHKLTRSLVDGYGLIASRRMGSAEMARNEGEAVRDLPRKAKRALNRESANRNWFEVTRQLEYKSAWAGRTFVKVEADAPTAQVCSACGYRNEALAGNLDQEWECPQCGAVHDRKLNGARNVLDRAHDILAGQEASYVSRARKAQGE